MNQSRRAALLFAALAACIAGAVYAGFCLLGAGGPPQPDFPLDDAWIHQVYVRSLWTEGQPAYNPGVPESGFTSPLWLIVNLPFYGVSLLFDAGPVFTAKLASLVFAIWAALAIGTLVERLGGGRMGRGAAIVLTLTAPGFAFSAVSAMEVTLAAAMMAQTLLALQAGRWRRAGLWAGLAGLARPEMALFVIGAALFGLTRPADNRRDRAVRLLYLLGIPAAFGSAWLLYNYSITGHFLPNTFYVKADGSPPGSRMTYYVEKILLDSGWAWTAVTVTLVALGALRVWRRPSARALVGLIVATQIVTIAAVALLHPLHPQVRFYIQRYFYPFTVFDAVLASIGVVALAEALARALPRSVARVLAMAPLCLVLLPLAPARSSYIGHCLDIFRLHTAPALELEANTNPSGHTGPPVRIAVEGAGAAQYHTSADVLDLLGLNHHPLAHADPDSAARRCLIVGHRPALFVVPTEPDDYVRALSSVFELQILNSYHSPEWAVAGGEVERVVVVARARLRPGQWERCAEEFAHP